MEFVSENAQAIVVAAVVLLVLLVVLGAWRAFSPRISGRRGQRLSISEYYELDKTRRLVLLRRDNVEHLVLIGGGQDVVIESGIGHGAGMASYAPQAAPAPQPAHVPPPIHAEQPPAGTARPAPRPPVFSDRKPPPLRPVGEPGAAPLRGGREEPEL